MRKILTLVIALFFIISITSCNASPEMPARYDPDGVLSTVNYFEQMTKSTVEVEPDAYPDDENPDDIHRPSAFINNEGTITYSFEGESLSKVSYTTENVQPNEVKAMFRLYDKQYKCTNATMFFTSDNIFQDPRKWDMSWLSDNVLPEPLKWDTIEKALADGRDFVCVVYWQNDSRYIRATYAYTGDDFSPELEELILNVYILEIS